MFAKTTFVVPFFYSLFHQTNRTIFSAVSIFERPYGVDLNQSVNSDLIITTTNPMDPGVPLKFPIAFRLILYWHLIAQTEKQKSFVSFFLLTKRY